MPGRRPAPVSGAWLVELPVRLQVDGIAGAEGDQLDVSSNPIDDPETPDPIAAQTLELVAKRTAAVRISKNRLERRSGLAFEYGMKATDQRRDLVRDSQTT